MRKFLLFFLYILRYILFKSIRVLIPLPMLSITSNMSCLPPGTNSIDRLSTNLNDLLIDVIPAAWVMRRISLHIDPDKRSPRVKHAIDPFGTRNSVVRLRTYVSAPYAKLTEFIAREIGLDVLWTTGFHWSRDFTSPRSSIRDSGVFKGCTRPHRDESSQIDLSDCCT